MTVNKKIKGIDMYFTKEKSNQKLTTTDIVVSIFATIFFLSVVYLGMVYA